MMKWWLIVLLASALVACESKTPEIVDLRSDDEKQLSEQETISDPESNAEPEIVLTRSNPNSPYSYRLIEGENGWGYQIYEDSTLRINQPHIPSVPGVHGFDTREKAELVAKYVLSETENGNFPPTMTPEILRKLGVIE